ncbi:MAG: tetratricopeptide repeat protein [Clostridia bacterium]|nr:tetratricopeptide repeat protein [Clostridia bacterium]
MAIIKCKMCGGDIAFESGKAYGTCEYCGSLVTFPVSADAQNVNLFNRANHFRMQNEFDKAIAAYERILEKNDYDAKAHWGIVLSRYGIEYVEDPTTHERIPTCHRLQNTSILSDSDYKAALNYAADSETSNIYRSEAERISEIQKSILAISSQEQPYDIFICYKETDVAGTVLPTYNQRII